MKLLPKFWLNSELHQREIAPGRLSTSCENSTHTVRTLPTACGQGSFKGEGIVMYFEDYCWVMFEIG